MKVFLIFLIVPISMICGQLASPSSPSKITPTRSPAQQGSVSASPSAPSKITPTSSPAQQGSVSNSKTSPIVNNGITNKNNILQKVPPHELLHQDVSQSVRLQEQVSQLSRTQLELSRKILSRIMELQTQLPKPLHQVMVASVKNKQGMTNNPLSQGAAVLSTPTNPNLHGQLQPASSPSQLLKNMEILKSNIELLKTKQTSIGTNKNLLKEPTTSPRRLGLAPTSQDIAANQPALPKQTVLLVDPDPNNVSINSSSTTNNAASTNKNAQPHLANTIQPILNAIRSRMAASSISSQVHSSHPQLGKETASTSFVDHLNKSPNTAQIQSSNSNFPNTPGISIANTNSQNPLQTRIGSNPQSSVNSATNQPIFQSDKSKKIQNQQLSSNAATQSQTSNVQSPFANIFPHGPLEIIQPPAPEGSPINIPRVNNSSLLFVTLPSKLVKSNPPVPSPKGNIPLLNIQESNSRILGTKSSSANINQKPKAIKASNNFAVHQNVPSGLGHSHTISNINPHQSIGSIVSELQTLIAKLEFLQYDFKMSHLLKSNPDLLSTKNPQSPVIKSTTNIQGSLKKSPAVHLDHSTAFSSVHGSLTQSNLNHHPVDQTTTVHSDHSTPFSPAHSSLTQSNLNHHQVDQTTLSQNQPVARRIAAESQNHPVVQSIASASQNQPLAQRIAAESQNHPVIQSIASTSQNQPVIQRRIATANQQTAQLAPVPSPVNTSNKRKFHQWWQEQSQQRPIDGIQT